MTSPADDGGDPVDSRGPDDLRDDDPTLWRRCGGAAATVFGLLAALAGVVSSSVYVGAAAGALGEADRSVVFWYSGFLVFGIALSAGGFASLLMLTSELRAEEAVLPRRAVRGAMWLLAGAGGLAAVAGGALAGWHVLMI